MKIGIKNKEGLMRLEHIFLCVSEIKASKTGVLGEVTLSEATEELVESVTLAKTVDKTSKIKWRFN